MVEKKVLHDLTHGMVLDCSILSTLPVTDVSQTIAGIRAAGAKPLYVVAGAAEFFTTENLLTMLAAKDKRVLIVNEGLGSFFTPQQIAALTGLDPVKGYGANALLAVEVIKPAAVQDPLIVDMVNGYTFAKVPEGWSIDLNISLGPTKIRRKIKNSDSDGTLFAMSPQDFEKLWVFSSEAWAGIEGAPLQASFSTYQGKLKATVQDDRIVLGGNYIRRYEIEQIAKYRNWAIPQAA